MFVSGFRYHPTVLGLSVRSVRSRLSVVPCPVGGHNAGIAGADVLQILVSIFVFCFKGYKNIASKSMATSSLNGFPMMRNSLPVISPVISRNTIVQTGTMPLLQSRMTPVSRNPSTASLTVRVMACSLIFLLFFKMNNPIGMLFPDFTGFSSLDWPFFVARLGRKKYRSVARMIFFSPTNPEGPPCTKNAIQDLCLVKTEKHRLHCQSQSRSRFVGRTKKDANLPVCILSVRIFSSRCHSPGWQVRKISSVTSLVRSATSSRKTSGVSSPLSMRASRASQPEVSAAFAIPIPLTVS